MSMRTGKSRVPTEATYGLVGDEDTGLLLEGDGLVSIISDGVTVWSSSALYSSHGSQFYCTDATEASVLAAVAAAIDNGGGTVYLPDAGSTGITLTAPLPWVTGVNYVGVPLVITHPGNVPDNDATFVGGSWFAGDGTFVCFQAQDSSGNALDAAKGSPDANFTTTGIREASISNVGISNFSKGLSAGNTNQCGPLYCTLQDIYMRRTTSWGLDLVNFMRCKFERIYCFSCGSGHRYAMDVASATNQPGNSYAHDLFDNLVGGVLTATQARNHRGIVFEATAGSNFNEFYGSRIQVNLSGKSQTTYIAASQSSNTFTLASGKGAELSVNMPVKFTAAGGNGSITVGLTYFVKTISTDTLTVSTAPGGSAVGGTFASAPTITTYGFGNMELIGYSTGTVTNFELDNVDLENVCQSALTLYNCTGSLFTVNELYANPGGEQHFVLRSSGTNQFRVPGPTLTTDCDGSSVQNFFQANRNITDCKQNLGPWWGKDSVTSRYVLSIDSENPATRKGQIESRFPSGAHVLYPLVGFGTRLRGDVGAGDGSAFSASDCGIVRCTASGTGAIAWNLPTIDNELIGAEYMFVNNRAGGGTPTLNITSQGTQYIDGVSGKNVVALAGPSGSTIAKARFIACASSDQAGSGYYWYVELFAGASIP